MASDKPTTESLQSIIKERDSKIEKLNKDIARLEANIGIRNDDISKKAAEITALKKEFDASITELTNFQNTVREQGNTIEELQEAIENLRDGKGPINEELKLAVEKGSKDLFHPRRGEKIDKNGNYVRTVNDVQVYLRDGDNINEKLKQAGLAVEE